MNERFDYAQVSSCMSNVDVSAKAARTALDKGTDALNTTINGAAGTGLSGDSAKQVAAKWDALTASFAEFTAYVNSIRSDVQTVSSQDQSFEAGNTGYTSSN